MTEPGTNTQTTKPTNGNGVNSLLKAFTPKQWIVIAVVLIALFQGNKAVNIPGLLGIQTMGQTMAIDSATSKLITLDRYEKDRTSDQFAKTLDSVNINNKLDRILSNQGDKNFKNNESGENK